jgi:hypothetical protein
MPLLDRFRTQPRQKHPDPAVRLSFVQELPLDEHDLLVEIARADEDARVRRAAASKLMSPHALAEIAGNDQDEDVRSQATAMLRDIALEAFEGISEADSLAAVDAVAEPKMLALIAKTAPRESVAARAASRVSEPRALGTIARHAMHETVRRDAFDRLQDRLEILAVAVNSEFSDPALAAVDTFTDRADLDDIATRAKNRTVAKRARQLIREIDERVAQEAAAADAALAFATEYAESERAAREAEERAAAAEREREAEAARLRAEDEESARVRAAHESAARARREAEEEARRQEAERRHARLIELVTESEAAAAETDLSAARRRMGVARKEWKDIPAGIDVPADLAARLAAADARIAARDSAAQDEDRRVRREALERLNQLAGRVEPLAARAELTLKAGERALRDVRAALSAIPPLPSRRDYEEIVHRLKAAQTALMPKVQELRDVADWQRWANVGIQEQLCEKMEALKALEDPEAIARHVRDLQQQWRQAADVPRAQGEALWRRFKTAHDEVWTRCEAHFAAQAEARAANLAKKLALAERAEALAESTRWIQTADEIKKLQADWKTIGPVTRGQEKAVWERFRVACDRFFTRRHADLVERKVLWAQNLAKKEALCARVEAIADSIDWDAAAVEIRRIQGEWKTIGPVKKNRAEVIWQRFRAACDRFFARYAQRHEIARGERAAAREAIIVELEALAAGEQPNDLAAKVRTLRGTWQHELALRGVDRDRAVALDERFAAAFNGVIAKWPQAFSGTDLDTNANRKRMEGLVTRMEELARSLSGPRGASDAEMSPTMRLAAMLKDALASNTIGGKVDEDVRLHAATEEVRQAQSAWSRIGPVPDDIRRALADRFQKAIRRITERAGQAGEAPKTGGPARAGAGSKSGG